MKLKVVGPRVLVKVKKYSSKKDNTFEGSSIVMPEDLVQQETVNQTVGEIVQLGDMAWNRKDWGCDGTPWAKVGDKVHFSRYGAMRINTKDDDEWEHWVLTDKDVLVIEQVEV